MGTGYTRNDTANNIADGNVINASDLDGEFDAIQAAFNGTTGHSHDGTTGEGPQIGADGIANNAVALGTKTTGNYVAAGAVSGVGLSGSASAEGATFTVTSNATDANTASTIVARDASGNFSAGTITATLSGNATTATTATTANSVAADSVALGTDTTGNYVAAGAVSGVGLSGSASAEGATFTVTSNATDANTASTIVARDASGNFSAGTITASLTGNVTGNVTGSSGSTTGNAATATALQTARTIAGKSFDGTANITIASTDLSDSGSIDAATLDSIDSTSFLRSDAADTKTSGDLTFSDDVKAIFGSAADGIQIYNTAAGDKFISEAGGGNLKIQGDNFYVQNSAGTENYIIAISDAAVTLYYDNAAKLATTATGVTVTGDATATGDMNAVDFNATSDERLKSNIRKIEGALDKVCQMNGMHYVLDGKESSGVIAQNIQTVAPEAVTDNGEYLTVAYNHLIGYLIEAVKELKTEIEELKNGNTPIVS